MLTKHTRIVKNFAALAHFISRGILIFNSSSFLHNWLCRFKLLAQCADQTYANCEIFYSSSTPLSRGIHKVLSHHHHHIKLLTLQVCKLLAQRWLNIQIMKFFCSSSPLSALPKELSAPALDVQLRRQRTCTLARYPTPLILMQSSELISSSI